MLLLENITPLRHLEMNIGKKRQASPATVFSSYVDLLAHLQLFLRSLTQPCLFILHYPISVHTRILVRPDLLSFASPYSVRFTFGRALNLLHLHNFNSVLPAGSTPALLMTNCRLSTILGCPNSCPVSKQLSNGRDVMPY